MDYVVTAIGVVGYVSGMCAVVYGMTFWDPEPTDKTKIEVLVDDLGWSALAAWLARKLNLAAENR